MDAAARVTSKVQVTIPKAVRDALGIKEATSLSSESRAGELCLPAHRTSSISPGQSQCRRRSTTSRGMR
jgi:AbrB family looped-hinge helix DNA binding protein